MRRALILLVLLIPVPASATVAPTVAFVEPAPLPGDLTVVAYETTFVARASAGSAPLTRLDIVDDLLAFPSRTLASCPGGPGEITCGWLMRDDNGMETPNVAYRDLVAIAYAEDGATSEAHLRVVRVDRGVLAYVA